MADYEARYGQPATGFAMLGYTSADQLVRALEAAGPDLTPDSFRAAMQGLDYQDELLDTRIKLSPENHQAANDVTISVVEGGVWKLIARQ
jgi:branched-chain amino acid transport system substrate-binding protein